MGKVYITITGMKHYFGQDFLKPGMKIELIKEPDNEFDKEAIRAEIKGIVEDFLNENLHLDLNKKTAIRPVWTGVDFVGFRIFATHRKLQKQTARRMIRNVKRLCEGIQEGKTSKDELLRTAASYNGILEHCNSYGLRRKLNEIYIQYAYRPQEKG